MVGVGLVAISVAMALVTVSVAVGSSLTVTVAGAGPRTSGLSLGFHRAKSNTPQPASMLPSPWTVPTSGPSKSVSNMRFLLQS